MSNYIFLDTFLGFAEVLRFMCIMPETATLFFHGNKIRQEVCLVSQFPNLSRQGRFYTTSPPPPLFLQPSTTNHCFNQIHTFLWLQFIKKIKASGDSSWISFNADMLHLKCKIIVLIRYWRFQRWINDFWQIAGILLPPTPKRNVGWSFLSFVF